MKVNFLSQKYKVLFIHIPKTGGSTIRDHLIRDFKKIRAEPNPSWDYNFSFAFVRNPYQRFCSAVSMFKHGSPKLVIPDPKLSIDDAISILKNESIGHEAISTDFRQHLKHHLIPMTHPYNQIRFADKIYKFEDYKNSYMDIKQKLNIDKELSHVNESRVSLNYKDVISETQRLELEKIFKKDLETFGYSW